MSCPSSIKHQDSNPRPLEHESSPITTRPVLLKLFQMDLAEGDSSSEPRGNAGSSSAQDRGGDQGEHVHRHPEAAQRD